MGWWGRGQSQASTVGKGFVSPEVALVGLYHCQTTCAEEVFSSPVDLQSQDQPQAKHHLLHQITSK